LNIYYLQYIVIFLICSSVILIKGNANCKLLVTFVLLTLISYFWASRELNVGSDTATYYQIFESIAPLTERIPSRDRIEIGYKYFISIYKIFSDSFFSFQFFSLFLIHLGIFLAIRMLTPFYFEVFSLVILSKSFLMYVINVQRQGFAFSLSMISISFLINKKYIPFIIFSGVAASFHTSSLFFNLTAFFIFMFRRNNLILGIFMLACFALFLTINSSNLGMFITGFSSELTVLNKITGYVENSKEAVSLGIGFVLSIMIISFSSYFYTNSTFDSSTRFNEIVKFSILVCVFNLIGLFIMRDFGVLSRIFSYIIVFEFLCFVWCISKFKNSNIIIIFFLLCASLYSVYGNVHSKLLNNPIGWL
jgi:hypothetical protein